MKLGKHIPDPLELVLRLATGMTFFGHGLQAVQGNANWLIYLETVGFSLERSKDIIELIGMMDLMVALIVLLKPNKYVVLWAFYGPFQPPLLGPCPESRYGNLWKGVPIGGLL